MITVDQARMVETILGFLGLAGARSRAFCGFPPSEAALLSGAHVSPTATAREVGR